MAYYSREDLESMAQWEFFSQLSASSTDQSNRNRIRNRSSPDIPSTCSATTSRAIPHPRSPYTLSDRSGINSNSAVKPGSAPPKDPKICSICGYKHDNGRCPPCPPDGKGDGSGDKKDDDDNDDECDDDDGGGGDNDPPPPGGDNGNDKGNMYADIFLSDEFIHNALCGVVGLAFLTVVVMFSCSRYPSLKDCILRNKCSGKVGVGQAQGSDLTSMLIRDAYTSFKSSMTNSACRNTYGDEANKCPGLVNYASIFGGASVVSTGKTQVLKNRMLCRCQDKDKKGHMCTPGDKSCSKCTCVEVTAATIIREESKLTPGICWAFSGVGEVQIVLILPIVVFGVTVHHPGKSRLPPGFISSAPKDFQLWGMNELDDPKPFYFGKFQYAIDGEPTQIFAVENQSPQKYAQVKFNFTSNHGNPNYTSLYKLEVHGYTDYAI